MKKMIFSGLIIASVTIFGSVSCGDSGPAEPIDCKADFECFIEASQNCRPATVIMSTTLDMFGLVITSTGYYEMQGAEADKCSLYMRTERVDVYFSDELIQQALDEGLTLEQIRELEQEVNRQVDASEGLDGKCKFDSRDLTTMLNRWKTGQFSTDDWKAGECEGDIFNQ